MRSCVTHERTYRKQETQTYVHYSPTQHHNTTHCVCMCTCLARAWVATPCVYVHLEASHRVARLMQSMLHGASREDEEEEYDFECSSEGAVLTDDTSVDLENTCYSAKGAMDRALIWSHAVNDGQVRVHILSHDLSKDVYLKPHYKVQSFRLGSRQSQPTTPPRRRMTKSLTRYYFTTCSSLYKAGYSLYCSELSRHLERPAIIHYQGVPLS
jgi:hypothetical protein